MNTPTQLNDPNRWQPLAVPDGRGGTVTQRFVTPHWGQVAPFALRSIDQYPVRTPARAGSAEYRAQPDEVLALSAGLTDRQKMIVEYWSDGHFRDGDLEGRRVGSDIGRAAWRASMRLIEGRGPARRGHARDGRNDNED